MDFAAWFEAYLDGRWHTFDARNNTPRVGRVVVGRGRDAVDVALLTSFGPLTLTGFHVFADEPPPAAARPSRSRPADRGRRPLSLGVLGRSRKEHERRLPIHPAHLERIDPDLRARIMLEPGYGERFGVPDAELAALVGGVRSRERAARRPPTSSCLPKPDAAGPRRAARRPGPVGLAALRPGRRTDPGRHRPAADADRLGGDEPLERRTGRSRSTSSTRTTSSPGTARSCTRWSSSASPGQYGRERCAQP